MKKRRKNIIKAVSVVGIVIILGIVWKIYNNLKTETYTFPENLVNYMGLTVEQQIEAINRENLTKDICTDVYATGESSFAIRLNKKQWEIWTKNANEKIESFEKEVAKKGGKLKVSDDRKSIIFEVSPEFYIEYIQYQSFRASVGAAEYQILTEENPEDWEVYLCIKNIETGEIIADGTLPYDTIEFMDEDLK